MTGVGPAEEPRVRVRESGAPRRDPRHQDADALGRHRLVNCSEEFRGICPMGGVGSDSAEQTPEPGHSPGCRGVVAGDTPMTSVCPSPWTKASHQSPPTGAAGSAGCGPEIAAVEYSSRARRGRSASRVPPVGSWGARREERQVDRVMDVVHAIRGTLREAGADRPDDDEAVLISEVRIEQDRGGYPTAGGLLALRVGAPDGRGGGHDASWGRWAAGGMMVVVTAVRGFEWPTGRLAHVVTAPRRVNFRRRGRVGRHPSSISPRVDHLACIRVCKRKESTSHRT